jgi:hypothetical protein
MFYQRLFSFAEICQCVAMFSMFTYNVVLNVYQSTNGKNISKHWYAMLAVIIKHQLMHHHIEMPLLMKSYF